MFLFFSQNSSFLLPFFFFFLVIPSYFSFFLFCSFNFFLELNFFSIPTWMVLCRNGNGSRFSIPEPDPDPARLLNGFFYRGLDPPPPSPTGSIGPVRPWYFRAHFVAQSEKKKCMLDIDFLSNQTRGEKEDSNPLFS